MTREEMMEWMISKELGNPKFQRFIDRKLYATDNWRTIDLLMELQRHIEGGEK